MPQYLLAHSQIRKMYGERPATGSHPGFLSYDFKLLSIGKQPYFDKESTGDRDFFRN
jgi:hypothetical protein